MWYAKDNCYSLREYPINIVFFIKIRTGAIKYLSAGTLALIISLIFIM